MDTNVDAVPSLTRCAECGMHCAPREFHPYAACLLFRACGNATEVRAHIATLRAPTAEQAEGVRSPWIDVADELPRSEWDKYYHDDFSAPVTVMIDYSGLVRRSEVTWRYSFAHGGWVNADLREGWKPSDYSDCGRVTHWAPLPEPLVAPAASAGDQS